MSRWKKPKLMVCGAYSALGLVILVYSAFPDRTPPIMQGILFNASVTTKRYSCCYHILTVFRCQWSLVSFLITLPLILLSLGMQTTTLVIFSHYSLRVYPILGCILVICGFLIGLYDPIKEIAGGANFWETSFLWQLLFILSFLLNSFGITIKNDYTVRLQTFGGQFSATLVFSRCASIYLRNRESLVMIIQMKLRFSASSRSIFGSSFTNGLRSLFFFG